MKENVIGLISLSQFFVKSAPIDNDLSEKVKRLDGGNLLSDYFTMGVGKEVVEREKEHWKRYVINLRKYDGNKELQYM